MFLSKNKLLIFSLLMVWQTSIINASSTQSIFSDKNSAKIQKIINSSHAKITQSDATLIDETLTRGEQDSSFLINNQGLYLGLNEALHRFQLISGDKSDRLNQLRTRSEILLASLSAQPSSAQSEKQSSSPSDSDFSDEELDLAAAMALSLQGQQSAQPEKAAQSEKKADASQDILSSLALFWDKNLSTIERLVNFEATQITSETAQIIEQAITLAENNLDNALNFEGNYSMLNFALSEIKIIDRKSNPYLKSLKERSLNLVNILSDLQAAKTAAKNAIDNTAGAGRHEKGGATADSPEAADFIQYAESRFYNPNVKREGQISFREIQSAQDYPDVNYPHHAQKEKDIIRKNLQPCKFIIDARGDGNCGYRAFLGSLFFNALSSKNNGIYGSLDNLLKQNFISLFEKYNPAANINASETLKYLLAQLNNLNQCKSIEEIRILLNKEVAFDYYMIMFFRYLTVDYINNLNINLMRKMIDDRDKDEAAEEFKQASENEIMIVEGIVRDARDNGKQPLTIQQYINKFLTWGDELTLDQARILAQVTNIVIHILIENNEYQQLAVCRSMNQSIGTTDLLFVGGHYRVFIPRSYEPDYLENFFAQARRLQLAGAMQPKQPKGSVLMNMALSEQQPKIAKK